MGGIERGLWMKGSGLGVGMEALGGGCINNEIGVDGWGGGKGGYTQNYSTCTKNI